MTAYRLFIQRAGSDFTQVGKLDSLDIDPSFADRPAALRAMRSWITACAEHDDRLVAQSMVVSTAGTVEFRNEHGTVFDPEAPPPVDRRLHHHDDCPRRRDITHQCTCPWRFLENPT